MAAQDSQGRYIAPAEPSVDASVASAERTASGTGTAFNTSGIDNITANLVVSAPSGTNPTLDVTLETTADGTNFYTAGTFAQQTTVQAGLARVFGDLGSLSRWRWVIGGTDTPTFTFAVGVTVDRDA